MTSNEVRATTPSIARLARAGAALAGALVASAALAASANAADAIYWGANNNPTYTIAKANVDGTGLNTSFFNVGSTVGGLGYNGSSIFWAGPNGVDKANIDGTGSSTSIYSGPVSPGLSIDSQYFYVGGISSNIIRGALDGSATDTSFISLSSAGASYTAVNATHIYFAGAGGAGPYIGRANIDGTGLNASFITGLSSGINGLAVDGSYLYWTYSSGSAIGRANLDGTGVNQTFITGLTQARAVAVDSGHLYWYSTATGNIARANLDGTGVNTSFIAGANAAGQNVFGLAVGPSGSAPKYALSVAKAGTGSGTVTSSPTGVDCGATCSAEYDSGTSVTLTAAAASGSTFTGWSGACSGAEATCTVSMSEARSVTATFSSIPPTPSNVFKLSAASTSGRTIRTLIRVSDPGRISQRGTRPARSSSARAAAAAVCSTSKTAPKAGIYVLTCKVNSATRKAQKNGTVRVLLRTTFTPTGGTARTVSRTVVLPSLKPKYTG